MRNPSVMKRWWIRRLYLQGVAAALRDGASLLDRVARNDPGTPSRVLVPHVVALADATTRGGEVLMQQGILRERDQAAFLGPLRKLLRRARQQEG